MNNITIKLVSATEITVEIPEKLNLNVAGIEELIEHLSQFRKSMNPEVPKSLPQELQIKGALIDPCWRVASPPQAEEKVLGIRHDRFGWLWFLLSSTEARKLSNALLVHSQLPIAPSSQSQPRH